MSYTYDNTHTITTEHRYTVTDGSSIHDVEAVRVQATSHACNLGIDIDDDNWAQIETSDEDLTIVFTSSDEVIGKTLKRDDITSTHEVSLRYVHAYHVTYFDPKNDVPDHDVDPVGARLTIDHSSDRFLDLTDHLTDLYTEEPAHVVRARVLGIMAAGILNVESDRIYDLFPV